MFKYNPLIYLALFLMKHESLIAQARVPIAQEKKVLGLK